MEADQWYIQVGNSKQGPLSKVMSTKEYFITKFSPSKPLTDMKYQSVSAQFISV